jgi:hypothetical protein
MKWLYPACSGDSIRRQVVAKLPEEVFDNDPRILATSCGQNTTYLSQAVPENYSSEFLSQAVIELLFLQETGSHNG